MNINDTTPKWLRLDNTSNIYPAIRSRNWSFQFRFTATLTEDLDPDVLQTAIYRVTARFPAYSMRLRSGVFWYFLQRIEGGPPVTLDGCCPCEPLRPDENNGFYFRVSYYRKCVSLDSFHALADGTGALSFFKTLLAEYLTLKYQIEVPRDHVILDCDAAPNPEEYEDSFRKYAGEFSRVPKRKRAYRIRGTREADGFIHLTTAMIPTDVIRRKAKEKNISVTQYLLGVLILSIHTIQSREVHYKSRWKPIHVLVPVNLRGFFPSITTRNFTGIITPGIDPKIGEYTLDEIFTQVHHYMGMEATAKNLQGRFTSFVHTEKNPAVRFIPLVLKNPALKLAHQISGDRKSCTTLTNIGNTSLPESMTPYVPRMELIIGPLSHNPVAFASMSYEGTLYMNATRTITDPKVEREFFTQLVRLGIPVKVESNTRLS